MILCTAKTTVLQMLIVQTHLVLTTVLAKRDSLATVSNVWIQMSVVATGQARTSPKRELY